MCLIEAADESLQILGSTNPKARKNHLCTECSRRIEVGEIYLSEATLNSDNEMVVYKTCAHCQIVRQWLQRNCSGWVYAGLLEDMQDHAQMSFTAARLAYGISNRWRTRKSRKLMPVKPLKGADHGRT